MPKLVLKSRKPLERTQIVTGTQDKSSIRSSLDVGHDVSLRACAVFVNVAGSHMTFIARHCALLTYSTMLAYRHLGPFLPCQLNANVPYMYVQVYWQHIYIIYGVNLYVGYLRVSLVYSVFGAFSCSSEVFVLHPPPCDHNTSLVCSVLDGSLKLSYVLEP